MKVVSYVNRLIYVIFFISIDRLNFKKVIYLGEQMVSAGLAAHR